MTAPGRPLVRCRRTSSKAIATATSISPIAGNGFAAYCGDGGPATDACISGVSDLDVAANGDIVLAEGSGRIRTIAAHDGKIETVTNLTAQPAGSACSHPAGRIALAPTGDMFLVSRGVCRLDRDTGEVSLVAGGGPCADDFGNPAPREGDPAVGACLPIIFDVLVDVDGALLIAELYKPRVWRVDPTTGRFVLVTGHGRENTLCHANGNGDGGAARDACLSPASLGLDGAGNLYVLDAGDGGGGDGARVRRISRETGVITTVAGNGTLGTCGDGGPAIDACIYARNLVVAPDGTLFLGGWDGVRRVDPSGTITTVAGPELGDFYMSLDAIDAAGRLLFFTDEALPRIRRLTVP